MLQGRCMWTVHGGEILDGKFDARMPQRQLWVVEKLWILENDCRGMLLRSNFRCWRRMNFAGESMDAGETLLEKLPGESLRSLDASKFYGGGALMLHGETLDAGETFE